MWRSDEIVRDWLKNQSRESGWEWTSSPRIQWTLHPSLHVLHLNSKTCNKVFSQELPGSLLTLVLIGNTTPVLMDWSTFEFILVDSMTKPRVCSSLSFNSHRDFAESAIKSLVDYQIQSTSIKNTLIDWIVEWHHQALVPNYKFILSTLRFASLSLFPDYTSAIVPQ